MVYAGHKKGQKLTLHGISLVGNITSILWKKRKHRVNQSQLQTWNQLQASMECGVGEQPHKTPNFHSRHRYPPSRNDPPKKSLGPDQPPPHRCRAFPILLVQMGYGLLCGLWVWRRRTNRRPCCPPMSNPSATPRTARPDGSGRWDNRMALQRPSRNLARPNSG